MDTLLQNLQIFFLLACVLPLIVLLVLGVILFFFGQRWVEGFVEPDVEQIQQQFASLQQQNPNAEQADLVRRVVNQQALKCGIVGAVTGLGGFVTLPIALPFDLLLTARYQSTMVSFIGQIYGNAGNVENKAATYAVMTGSTQATQMTARLLQQYLPRIIGKSFSKFIPFFGAIISFVVNYALAQATGRLAVRWYESRSNEQPAFTTI